MCAQNPSSIPEFFLVEDSGGQLGQGLTIDVLPDDVLLEIFDIYLKYDNLDAWQTLCRRWRQLVFASPRRLNLRLYCTQRTPVPDIWPALPIVIEYFDTMSDLVLCDAALKHSDRVCEITISRDLSSFLNLMMVPFPVLTSLDLRSDDEDSPVLPDSFLGGYAPCLQTLFLSGVPFPGLPKLLLSAHHLISLDLGGIPDSGYISPEMMVTAISSLTKLERLDLEFQSPLSRPRQTNRHLPPPTRTVLPSLTYFMFEGDGEYLEYIVAPIDAPLLNNISITFTSQLLFDTPRLRSFISRTEIFKAVNQAEINFCDIRATLTLLRERRLHSGKLQLGMVCEPTDPQPSAMARVCNSSLPPVPTLECLTIFGHHHHFGLHQLYDMDNTQSLEMFHPFITVRSLYLCRSVAPCVARVLQELTGERVTDVLPALQDLSVDGPVQEAIEQFIAARQLLGRPVTIWYGYSRKLAKVFKTYG